MICVRLYTVVIALTLSVFTSSYLLHVNMQELSTKNVSIGVVGSDRSFEIIENDSLEPFFTLAMAEEVRAVLQIDTFVGVMFALIGL